MSLLLLFASAGVVAPPEPHVIEALASYADQVEAFASYDATTDAVASYASQNDALASEG